MRPTEATEAERLQPGSGRRGERPAHPSLLAGDRVHLGRGHAGQVVGGPEPFLQSGDGVGADRGIGIEEQQIVGDRVPAQRPVLEADVHPGAESEVPPRVDVGRPVALGHRLHRGIGGVVDDHDGQLVLQPVQTSVEQIGCAERHHQDVDATGHQRLRRPGLEGADLRSSGVPAADRSGGTGSARGHCL